MNAIHFIQQNDLQKVRKILEGAPSNAESFQGGYYFRTKPEFQFHNGFHPAWNLTYNNGEYFKKRGFDPVDLNELKRLVESIDMIIEYGGIDQCHKEIEWAKKNKWPETTMIKDLEQAIADYEKIYGVNHAE